MEQEKLHFYFYFVDPEYAHFVIQRHTENLTESLFELNTLLAMCELESRLEHIDEYQDLCERGASNDKCCRPWSLPNYIALLSNRSNCFDIENEDVQTVKQLLTECFDYYHSMKLSNDCVNNKCQVPVECEQQNAIYNIFHYIIDAESINVNVRIFRTFFSHCPFKIFPFLIFFTVHRY